MSDGWNTRSVRVGVILMIAIAAASCSSSSSPSAKSTPTSSTTPATSPSQSVASLPAASVAREAETNALRSGWAHIDARSEASGKTIVVSQDSGPNTGRQSVTIGSDHATVMLIRGIAYVNANAGALRDFVGLPASSASLAGKWISISPSDPGYASVSTGVTLRSALQQVSIQAPFTNTGPSIVDGQHVIGIRGMVATGQGDSEAGTLFVPSSGAILPVAISASGTQGTEQAAFSAWGTAVTLTPPANPIPVPASLSTS